LIVRAGVLDRVVEDRRGEDLRLMAPEDAGDGERDAEGMDDVRRAAVLAELPLVLAGGEVGGAVPGGRGERGHAASFAGRTRGASRELDLQGTPFRGVSSTAPPVQTSIRRAWSASIAMPISGPPSASSTDTSTTPPNHSIRAMNSRRFTTCPSASRTTASSTKSKPRRFTAD